jgi:hypothetical protein
MMASCHGIPGPSGLVGMFAAGWKASRTGRKAKNAQARSEAAFIAHPYQAMYAFQDRSGRARMSTQESPQNARAATMLPPRT